MNHRQRVQAALRFERPDRLPCNESFWDGTLEAWRKQGMPADVEPADVFDFDVCTMFLDASPRLEQKVIERGEGYVTFEDRFGYTVRKLDGLSGTMDFIDHVTVDRDAWDRIKPRFALSDDPAEPARIDRASYFAHFGDYPSWTGAVEQYGALHATDRYMLFAAYGPWEATWRHRGMERLLYDVAEQPDWIEEMARTYQDLVLAIIGRCLDEGMKPDGFLMVEDLGWNLSMLMSPATWRTLLKPSVARLGQFLADRGIDLWMHSDGAIFPVLDDLIDCGVRALNPLEVTAGFDVVDVRKRYGTRLAFYGNIDVKKMLAGEAELRAELERKIPPARGGGYILHSDHSVPPQVDYARYQWMLKTAREIFLA